MFDSSKDILFLVIALAVAILTFFTSWLLYYLIRILRTGYRAVSVVSEKIETLASLIDALKDKIEHSASAFTVLSQAILKLVGSWQKRRSRKPATATKSDDVEAEDF